MEKKNELEVNFPAYNFFIDFEKPLQKINIYVKYYLSKLPLN